MYYWKRGKFGLPFFMQDDHALALYAGNKRISKGPVPVWWFPTNWLVVPVGLLLLAAEEAKKWARQ